MEEQNQPIQPPTTPTPPMPAPQAAQPAQPVDSSGMVMVNTPTDPRQVHSELSKFDFWNSFIKFEKGILRALSLLLLLHGLYGVYNEMVEIFYVFPHLPEFFKEVGYADTAFQTLYRKSVLVTATAAIETIYAIAVISRLKHLVHRLHIFSAAALFVISLFISQQNQSLDNMQGAEEIPEPPNIPNLIQAESNEERWELFKLEPVED